MVRCNPRSPNGTRFVRKEKARTAMANPAKALCAVNPTPGGSFLEESDFPRLCREEHPTLDLVLGRFEIFSKNGFVGDAHLKSPKGPKIEIIQDLEIIKRDWNFKRAAPDPYFVWGVLKVKIENFNRDWKFQARLNFFNLWALRELKRGFETFSKKRVCGGRRGRSS